LTHLCSCKNTEVKEPEKKKSKKQQKAEEDAELDALLGDLGIDKDKKADGSNNKDSNK